MSEDQPEKKKRKPNPALMKPVQPDELLAVVVGSTPIPRSEITKKLWDYIKSKGLQNPEKKTEIVADDALKAVFGGKERVTMFEMTKLVSQHIQGCPGAGRPAPRPPPDVRRPQASARTGLTGR